MNVRADGAYVLIVECEQNQLWGTVEIVEVKTGKVVGTIEAHTLNRGPELTPDNKYAWIVDRRDCTNAYLAESKGCGHQEWGAELGFHHVCWAPSGRASSELLPVGLRIRRHDDLSNALPLVRGSEVELLVEGESHIDSGMRAPTAGIRLKTDLLATKNASQIVGQFL